MKAFITGVLFAGCATHALAHPVSFPGDTVRREPSINVKKEYPVVITRAANVVFPEILSGHEDQAMDYVALFSERRRDYLLRTYQRGLKFFPKVEKIFRQYDVPVEFRVLLALESGFNANAVSPAGAVGYWQIMDFVAKEYGMRITQREKKVTASKKMARGKKGKRVISKETPIVVSSKAAKKKLADDRTNFLKSTQVAARYLRDRSRNLNNDWLLIAASYNCGVGNVWNAMERCGKKNPGFWDIRKLLPAETQAYVMNFIALNVIFHNYEAFEKNELCFRDETCIDDSGEYCQEELDGQIVSSMP